MHHGCIEPLRQNLALNRTPHYHVLYNIKTPKYLHRKNFSLKYFKKTGFLPLFERDNEGTFFGTLKKH